MTALRTHPFRGGIPFPVDRPEASALRAALERDVADPHRIDLLARQAYGNLPALNLFWTPAQLWGQVLGDLSRADRLIEFCEILVAQQGLVAVARAARAMLDARSTVERRMAGERLVVDREALRGHIAELARDGALLKVLLVRGLPQTGKSWSRHLFESAARDRGADVVYLRPVVVPTVDHVLRKLFEVLQAPDKIPPRDGSEGDWYRSVSFRLPAMAELRGRPLWIAVDDLGPGPDGVTPQADSGIRAFFDQLALTLEDPSANRWLRLLLIHYPDDDEPTRWSEDVWTADLTRPETVTADDVADVLREWRDDHGVTLLDDQITVRAHAVVARADQVLPPDDPRSRHCRLRRIHDEVRAELATLAGGGP